MLESTPTKHNGRTVLFAVAELLVLILAYSSHLSSKELTVNHFCQSAPLCTLHFSHNTDNWTDTETMSLSRTISWLLCGLCCLQWKHGTLSAAHFAIWTTHAHPQR